MKTQCALLIDRELEERDYLSRLYINGSFQIDLEHLENDAEVEAFLADFSSGSGPKYDKPVFIILDIDFPDAKSGLSLLKKIKRNRHFAQTPVFVFTNNNDKNIIAQSYVNGANAYFLKPDSADGFSESLKMLTERWQQLIQRGFGYNYHAV